ncbi:colicin immunity domain-containing protein [Streptomyces microflavus]|nr:colicin immunity domain-containing protein [Streptomyces microflavus]
MAVLDGQGTFSEQWLSAGEKKIVPVPAGNRTDGSLGRRITEGCRTAGADAVLVMRPSAGAAAPADSLSPTDHVFVALPPPLLLATANLEGAVLFSGPGYALVAGTSVFLAGAAPEGVDQARARFARYARAAARKWPALESTARSFPPGHIAWKSPRDVPEATATGQQLALMRDVAAGRCTGAEFAVGWLDARRRSQQQGERVRDPLETLLDRVFSLLEDYSMDSQFKEPEDLSDDELKNAVSELLRRHTVSRASARARISSVDATAFTHRRD